MTRCRKPGRPANPLVQIDVKLTLPRQVGWMLTGAAIGNLHALGELLEKISRILQSLPG